MSVWFKAKQYGWGWFPVTWQGWTVILVYCALVVLLMWFAQWRLLTPAFVLGIVLLVIALIAVCYVKGERPRWRWGK